jgi:threonine aldolase
VKTLTTLNDGADGYANVAPVESVSYPLASTTPAALDRYAVDLRSDTVTRPSPSMLEAMIGAPVGNDVYGDDPTVRRLQDDMAQRTGKEAALFFPSGTQSNLAAVMNHCRRGEEYFVDQRAHTYRFEGGGAVVLGSIQPQPIENAPDGSLPLEAIAAEIKFDDSHFPITRLLALENTINGKVLPQTTFMRPPHSREAEASHFT